MKKCAFLFDLDGVLVDTAIFHFEAWKKLTQSLSFTIDEAFNETLKGVSRMESLDRILEYGKIQLSEEEKLQLAHSKNEHYLQLVNTMTPQHVLPGVLDFLEASRSLNIKIALGSASKNARTILQKTQIETYFDAIVDGNLVSRSKPDPEVFIKGAEALNVNAFQCVVFEDAVAGIEAAKRANMKAVGVGETTLLSLADIVIPNFIDVHPDQFI